MRVVSVALVSLWLTTAIVAQTPPKPTQAPVSRPDGNLAQVMRGILFPNSNNIFATQQKTPAEVEKIDVSPGSEFADVYVGWQVIENSALALAESANLISIPGRLCANGRPVPVQRADWIKFTQGLREAGMATYKAAQTKNQDNMIEASGVIAEACENCHAVYREKPDLRNRCVP